MAVSFIGGRVSYPEKITDLPQLPYDQDHDGPLYKSRWAKQKLQKKRITYVQF